MTRTEEQATTSTSAHQAADQAILDGNFSMLALLLPEADPVEEAKTKATEVTKVIWWIHRWQEGEFNGLSKYLKAKTTLKVKQIKAIRSSVTKEMSEDQLIVVVNAAMYE